MNNKKNIDDAMKHFGWLLEEQLTRIEIMKITDDWMDYKKLKPIKIGILSGDGIGPYICKDASKILKFLLNEEIKMHKILIKNIKGLTIENRVKTMEVIPSDVLNKLKTCHVILKGPTTTPGKGDKWPNIESANVTIRRELDLFANVRPITIPEHEINWTFFRENIEGPYMLGSKGINITDDLAVDFTITTKQGSARIIELAFDYAKKHKINKLTVVTKANVIKTTDGKFLSEVEEISKRYPDIKWDSWYIDNFAAKIIEPVRRNQFKVIVLPNLYGDIITDIAAQIQGGVGTAGSANIGKHYAMFEAIHGSGLKMVKEGRAKYANPLGIMRATAMLLRHIGLVKKAIKLERVLDLFAVYEKEKIPTGYSNGVTGEDFTNYILETLQDLNYEKKFNNYEKIKNRNVE